MLDDTGPLFASVFRASGVIEYGTVCVFTACAFAIPAVLTCTCFAVTDVQAAGLTVVAVYRFIGAALAYDACCSCAGLIALTSVCRGVVLARPSNAGSKNAQCFYLTITAIRQGVGYTCAVGTQGNRTGIISLRTLGLIAHR